MKENAFQTISLSEMLLKKIDMNLDLVAIRDEEATEKLREMGMAGRQQIMQRFHYLTMARNFERVYRQTIAAFEQARAKE